MPMTPKVRSSFHGAVIDATIRRLLDGNKDSSIPLTGELSAGLLDSRTIGLLARELELFRMYDTQPLSPIVLLAFRIAEQELLAISAFRSTEESQLGQYWKV